MLFPAPGSPSSLFFFNGCLLLCLAVLVLSCSTRAFWLQLTGSVAAAQASWRALWLQPTGSVVAARAHCPATRGIAVAQAGMGLRPCIGGRVFTRTPRKLLPALCLCLCFDGMRNSAPLGEIIWVMNWVLSKWASLRLRPGGREEMMVGQDQADLGRRGEKSWSAGPGRRRQWLTVCNRESVRSWLKFFAEVVLRGQHCLSKNQ